MNEQYKNGVCVCCGGSGKSNDNELKSLFNRDKLIILTAKKEVFDDIEKLNAYIQDGELIGRFTDSHGYNQLKKKHLER